MIGETYSVAAGLSVFALESVCYSYAAGVPALMDITVRVAAGESVVILGANGSGKSTLIKLLDGLLFPQSGRFDAFGQEVTEAAMRDERYGYQFRRRVGFIFQNSDAQLFSTTVREEIAFGPLQMGLPIDRVEERVEEIAALLEIGKLLDRPPYHLSGGEKKKVAIAAALVINPDVLLLDEPLSGLDPRSQHWLVALMSRLKEAGKTLVTATHDLNVVPQIADRALVFSEDHRLVADGAVREILKDTDLLLRVNLIHEHLHRHGTLWHDHPHAQNQPHQHDDNPAIADP